MEPRDLVVNNWYIGPASSSVESIYANQLAETNWGVPVGQVFLVKLSPQVDEDPGHIQVEPWGKTRGALLARHLPHEPMSEITSEFAALGERVQIEQVLSELRADEEVQQPSLRDLRHNYRRYDVPG